MHRTMFRQGFGLAVLASLAAASLQGPALAAPPEKQPAARQAETKRAERPKVIRDEDLPWPPALPGGKSMLTDSSPDFLKPPATLKADVAVAKTAPTIEFMYYPEQNYPGKPWSNWGDGSVADGKFYSAVGDHYALGRGASPHSTGTAHIYEYDPATKKLRSLVDITKLLNMPEGHYTPGKVHTRVDQGSDGWLYYATHRGSPAAASDANHYLGDWIFRTNPKTGKSEVVVHAPVPKHSIPNGMLDPDRLIYYGGTAAGPDAEQKEIQFLAYDLKGKKLLYSGPNGPARYMMLARSTGRLYFVPGNTDGQLMRYDPTEGGAPTPVKGVEMGIRAATNETADGMIYTVSIGQGAKDADVWAFNTKTEQAEKIGALAVGNTAYVASLDVDPTGRFLYYVPGAHGSGPGDGSPLVQFDIASGKKKVIAFLHPYYEAKYGFIPKGTYSTDISPEGDKVYVTWNVSRGTRAWDCCGLSVIHIPASER